MEYIKIDKELYPKIVVLKAAYQFTYKAYIFVNADRKSFNITIESKNKKTDDSLDTPLLVKEFKNELLIQAVKHQVFLKTKNIREMIVARAIATSSIGELENDYMEENDYDADSILKDWFENE